MVSEEPTAWLQSVADPLPFECAAFPPEMLVMVNDEIAETDELRISDFELGLGATALAVNGCSVDLPSD
jgi:hypothetical protein